MHLLHVAFGTADLAAGKNLVRCFALIAAAVPALLQALQSSPGNVDLGLASLWPSISAVGVIAMTYSALGPGALSAVLQTYGQRSVSAPVAQVLLLTCSMHHIDSMPLRSPITAESWLQS